MPKIIENVREQLLEEAKRQIAEYGYSKTTIRSVSKACGLASGTVYNYFPSKDMLIASVMAEDWKLCLQRMEGYTSEEPERLIHGIYATLSEYIQKYHALFCDKDAVKVYATMFTERHQQLRQQLSVYIRNVCDRASVSDKDFLAEWIAESILTWTIAGKGIEEQYEIIKQLIKSRSECHEQF